MSLLKQFRSMGSPGHGPTTPTYTAPALRILCTSFVFAGCRRNQLPESQRAPATSARTDGTRCQRLVWRTAWAKPKVVAARAATRYELPHGDILSHVSG